VLVRNNEDKPNTVKAAATPERPGKEAGPAWLRPATDYLPLIIFLAVYLLTDILTATGALIAATAVALAVSWAVARRVPWLALFAAVLLGFFGGLTLVFEDSFFIKIKPTVVQILFAAALWGTLAIGRPVLKTVMGAAFPLKTDQPWTTLTHRFAVFFLIMAAANEVVWRTQTEEVWVAFDTIGQMVITFIFVMSQVPLLLKHRIDEEEEPSEP
jgi:intracellular septation protein|tara:strand:+ start:31423 stop:32064 length:642 start_codon:yes stop_codon:yes gene_type:complete